MDQNCMGDSYMMDIPQALQSTSVWNDTVMAHPWTASINDSSIKVCINII